MSLNFTTVDAPKASRQPNPFDDVFPTEAGKAVKVTLPGLEDGPKDNDDAKAIRRAVKQAREAANDKGFSVTITRVVGGTKAKPETSLTFATRDKITRTRAEKPADAAKA